MGKTVDYWVISVLVLPITEEVFSSFWGGFFSRIKSVFSFTFFPVCKNSHRKIAAVPISTMESINVNIASIIVYIFGMVCFLIFLAVASLISER